MTDLTPLFAPETIAVVGASSSGDNVANRVLRNLANHGFKGRVVAIHPRLTELNGTPACPSLAAAPFPIDYAFVAVAAEQTPHLLEGAEGKVKFMQVISSGFAETGRSDLQADLVASCKRAGTRLIGPNCLGLHLPAKGLTYVSNLPSLPAGPIAVVSQSGGLSVDIIRRGQVRGIGFRSVISIGNSADLSPSEIAEYLLSDPGTQAIGLYLEDVADGRRFFDALRRGAGAKPVVILKGGATEAGQRAAASHTGALAGEARLWSALARQTGAIMVETVDELIDTLLALQYLHPRRGAVTRRVALFGNGGGTSVVASDAFSRAGFQVPALSSESVDRLRGLGLPPGSSFTNPVDVPGGALRVDAGRVSEHILEAIYLDQSIDAVVVHLNMPVLLGYRDPAILPNLIRGALAAQARHRGRGHIALVLRSDGDLDSEQRRHAFRQEAIALGVPVFDELPVAARALAGIAWHEHFLHRRN